MAVGNEAYPEADDLTEVAISHFIFVDTIFLDEVQSRRVFHSFVEVTSLTILDHVEKRRKTNKGDVLLLPNKLLNQQPLHFLTYTFEAK